MKGWSLVIKHIDIWGENLILITIYRYNFEKYNTIWWFVKFLFKNFLFEKTREKELVVNRQRLKKEFISRDLSMSELRN